MIHLNMLQKFTLCSAYVTLVPCAAGQRPRLGVVHPRERHHVVHHFHHGLRLLGEGRPPGWRIIRGVRRVGAALPPRRPEDVQHAVNIACLSQIKRS